MHAIDQAPRRREPARLTPATHRAGRPWRGPVLVIAVLALAVLGSFLVPPGFPLTREELLLLAVFVAVVVLAGLLTRHRAERTAAGSATTLAEARILVAGALDAVVCVDRRGRIRLASPQVEAAFGIRAAHLRGHPLGALMSERSSDGLRELIDRCYAATEGRAGTAGCELTARRRDGSEFAAEVRLRRLDTPVGVLIACTIRDITERRRAEEQLAAQVADAERARRRDAETASRIRDEFLATVSHELRTPLTSMLGWARLLRTRSLDPVVTARALDSIERNARLEAELIDNLLDVARLITGRVHLHVDRVDLGDVAGAAIETVAAAASAKNIAVVTDVAAGAAWIVGDRARLVQVVWHLLANAIKVTPRGGRVEVHVAGTGEDRVRLDVRDTGRGIAADFLPFVFDRFRQAEAPLRRVGLGLGLAIVRHLVELHGGTVSVASAGEGRGATFTVELPRAVGAGGGAVETPQRSSG